MRISFPPKTILADCRPNKCLLVRFIFTRIADKSINMATAIILGATGLVGRQLLPRLLDDDRFTEVRAVLRRSTHLDHPKLREIIVDFDRLEEWAKEIEGDVLFSTFGTTAKQAGSKEAQYLVDYTYQFEVAKIAAENGVSDYVLVSTPGADPKSRLFYPRIRGELDRDVQTLSFSRISILKPSVLVGERKENRLGESVGIRVGRLLQSIPFFKKYRPIKGGVVAAAMQKAYQPSSTERVRTFEWEEVFQLAGLK